MALLNNLYQGIIIRTLLFFVCFWIININVLYALFYIQTKLCWSYTCLLSESNFTVELNLNLIFFFFLLFYYSARMRKMSKVQLSDFPENIKFVFWRQTVVFPISFDLRFFPYSIVYVISKFTKIFSFFALWEIIIVQLLFVLKILKGSWSILFTFFPLWCIIKRLSSKKGSEKV